MERAFVLTGAMEDWNAETEWLPSDATAAAKPPVMPFETAKGALGESVGMRLGEYMHVYLGECTCIESGEPFR